MQHHHSSHSPGRITKRLRCTISYSMVGLFSPKAARLRLPRRTLQSSNYYGMSAGVFRALLLSTTTRSCMYSKAFMILCCILPYDSIGTGNGPEASFWESLSSSPPPTRVRVDEFTYMTVALTEINNRLTLVRALNSFGSPAQNRCD